MTGKSSRATLVNQDATRALYSSRNYHQPEETYTNAEQFATNQSVISTQNVFKERSHSKIGKGIKNLNQNRLLNASAFQQMEDQSHSELDIS